jgi:TolA-binding protein
MARRISRKELLKQDEFVEAAFDFGHWLEENWQKVAAGAGALIALAAIVGGIVWFMEAQAGKAAERLADAQRRYIVVSDNGFADTVAIEELLSIFDDLSGGSEPGQQARYFQSALLFRTARYDEAIPILEEIVQKGAVSPTLVGASEVLLANTYVAAGQADRAVAMLSDEERPSQLPESQALLLLGRIQLELGDADAARSTLQKVLDKHSGSAAAVDARELL